MDEVLTLGPYTVWVYYTGNYTVFRTNEDEKVFECDHLWEAVKYIEELPIERRK